jgi:hypothetical protein
MAYGCWPFSQLDRRDASADASRDTLDNRRTLEQIMEAGNETYGDDTHWIEEREA